MQEARRPTTSLVLIFGHWKATVFSAIVTSLQAWISLVLFTVISILNQHTDIEFPDMSPDAVGQAATAMTFFLTFFASQSFSRLNEQYFLSMTFYGRVFDIATLARSYMPLEHARRLVRHANAAHLLTYLGLSGAYNTQNILIEFNKTHKLLTQREMERLQAVNVDVGGNAHREVISWCMQDVKDFADQGKLPWTVQMELHKQILAFRGVLGTLFDYADFPVPFFYIHLVWLLTDLYLLIFAYAMALQYKGKDMWTGYFPVVMNMIFVIGLRHIGVKFADPYGNDIEDLPVMSFVMGVLNNSRKILEAIDVGAVDAAMEEDMLNGKATPTNERTQAWSLS